MAMELFGLERAEEIYDAEDAREAKYLQFESIVDLFGWVATIDSFQHWVYTHSGHSREQSIATWVGIMDRYATGQMDWSGLEEIRAHRWLRQSHLFGVPFYYVEYAIAQLGALQVWRNHRQDPNNAIQLYREGLALGNTRSLPELYAAAGIQFDFSRENLEQLISMVREEIDTLEKSIT